MRHYKIETIQHRNLQGKLMPKQYHLLTIEGDYVFSSTNEDLIFDLEFVMESARIRRWVPANMFALQDAGVDLFKDDDKKHTHTWKIRSSLIGNSPVAICINCPATLDSQEIEYYLGTAEIGTNS